MALEAGTRFGPYEISEQIGAGGMGEVYRARDTVLKRDVAIKVLPESFTNDADRLARFQREAEVLASLNHANIAQIYGLEAAGGRTAIIMELIEGPTLEDRIGQGPIPLDDALGIARQIASALAAAHERQVVHRDLKPGNVKLKADGTVKVLDFGIAKALDAEAISGGRTPAKTTPAMTETGVILGTAAYMAPEQARGQFVDQRADIWAFGCLLFEMLTGQPAFGGEDVMMTLARVLDRDTDLSSIPGSISPAVRHTIKLCLEKDPGKRIADIRDVRLALDGTFDSDLPRAVGQDRAAPNRWLPAAAGAALMGIAAALVVWTAWPEAGPEKVTRSIHSLPPGVGFRSINAPIVDVAASGLRFAYNTAAGVYIRDMDDLEGRQVPTTQGSGIGQPMLSPEGTDVAFVVAYTGELVRIPVGGGSRTVIANVGVDLPRGMHWAEDDTIWLARRDGIYRVSAAGGELERMIEARDGERLYYPQFVPDRDAVIYSVHSDGDTNWDAGRIVVEPLGEGERQTLINGGSDGRLLPSGHLAYSVGNDVFAAEVDTDDWTVTSQGREIIEGVMRGGLLSPATHYAVAEDGTLVYALEPAEDTGGPTLVWVDPEAGETPFELPQPRGYRWVRISPSGRRVAATIAEQGRIDVWVTDVTRPVFNPISSDEYFEFPPLWSTSEDTVTYSVFAGGQGGILQVDADGASAAEEVVTLPTNFLSAEDWGCTEQQVVFTYGTLQGGRNELGIGILDRDSDAEGRQWRPLIDRDTDASMLSVSPDCEWIAYQSGASGQYGVYIERFPTLGSREPISDEFGGWAPVWSQDGSKLYYRRLGDGAMMVVDIETSPELRIGAPEVYFENQGYVPLETPVAGGGAPRNWDVAPDGRFLMLKANPSSVTREIIVVENWLQEL